jgi:hypothetical protein
MGQNASQLRTFIPLEKLMKFHYAMSLDRRSKGSEIIYRSSNQGCDGKTLGALGTIKWQLDCDVCMSW